MSIMKLQMIWGHESKVIASLLQLKADVSCSLHDQWCTFWFMYGLWLLAGLSFSKKPPEHWWKQQSGSQQPRTHRLHSPSAGGQTAVQPLGANAIILGLPLEKTNFLIWLPSLRAARCLQSNCLQPDVRMELEWRDASTSRSLHK